jgi:murein L,D-transpeptidase YcbB/YkuD
MNRIGLVLFVAGWALAGSAHAQPSSAPHLTPAERAMIVETLSGGSEFDDGPPADRSEDVLWAALVRHATGELGLRIAPSDIDPLWAIAPKPRQVEAELRSAQAAGRLASWLATLPPGASRYRALQAVRGRYRQIVDAGGWAQVPKEAAGAAAGAPALAALRARLIAEGYLARGQAPGQGFDAGLRRALTDFQTHHELKADGGLGAQTLAALNIPAEARLAQIDANLERWRWLPALPAQRVEVDIAGAEATLYAHDQAQLSMRVIVGDRTHRTPMFASRLEGVVFNPPWNVPASIAAKELLPKERAHPGYLARNDFIFVGGALRQQPGPRNSLGQVKFDFPSPFGVYLHDTPARAIFAQAERWRSHGCVRLEKPRELAAAVLGPQGWTPDRIDAAIEAGDTSRVGLSVTVPLYVLYWTVVISPDGAPDFRRDTYGWDAKLTRALAQGGGGGGNTTQADSECSAAKTLQPLLQALP